MILSMALAMASFDAPSALLGLDGEVEWQHYHSNGEGMDYYWNPANTGTVMRDGREILRVHARSIPEPEERGGEYESSSHEWLFAVDCDVSEIAIIAYATGKTETPMADWKSFVLEAMTFKEIGMPPGGSYETELAGLVCA